MTFRLWQCFVLVSRMGLRIVNFSCLSSVFMRSTQNHTRLRVGEDLALGCALRLRAVSSTEHEKLDLKM